MRWVSSHSLFYIRAMFHNLSFHTLYFPILFSPLSILASQTIPVPSFISFLSSATHFQAILSFPSSHQHFHSLSYQSPLSLTRTLLPCPLKPSLPPISFILLLLLHPLPPHLNAPDSFSWTTSHSSNKSNLLTLVLCLMTSFRGPRCDIVMTWNRNYNQKPRTVSV